ncbi:MAG: 16S rRNA (cytosine(1402)-N(4))-methyltransferase RsmH [Alphaproteobacteria bacterium]|nr:16S rRNA (cytosine(1402)-N(4))-methyltransferase RsmH [Alphaproteobacteria bacterium]
MAMKHIPVLLDSVLEALGDISGLTVVDCTFGAGGYSRAFLKAGANVIAFDRDPNVLSDVEAMKAEFGDRFSFVPKTFSHVSELESPVDAIVFDLGISSMQIDIASRGFSFRADAPLDMRMSVEGMTAAQFIEKSTVAELTEVLRQYGDVKKAGVLAKAIKEALPQTTFALRDLIYNPHDVAPVFQALRIAVNDEMGELERALGAVPELLKCGGKCVCVTFHSLEDRIVKNTFRKWTTPLGDPRMPVLEPAQFELLRTQLPTDVELENNSRARSAHMRGVIKLRG